MVMWNCWSRCDGDEAAGGRVILIASIGVLASERSPAHGHHTVSTSTLTIPTSMPALGAIVR